MKQKQSKPAAYFDVPAMNATAVASQLHTVCKDVEEAIKEKEGSEDSINPKQFGDRIRNLSGSSGKMGYTFIDVSSDEGKMFVDAVGSNLAEIGAICKIGIEDEFTACPFFLFEYVFSSVSGFDPIENICAVALPSITIMPDVSNDLLGSYYDTSDVLQLLFNGLRVDINAKEFIEQNKITEEEFLSGLTYVIPPTY